MTNLKVFIFYCKSFDELESKLSEAVGYTVKINDIWSIHIDSVLDKLRITATIYYSERQKPKTT